MGLTTADVLAGISAMHRKRGKGTHPIWQGLVEGTHNLAQVQYICKQHSIVTMHNHNYHGRLYVSCPDAEWRERLAEVAYEEATGRLYANGVSHHKLYLNYGKGLGISQQEMYDVEYAPSALLYRLYLSDVCSRFIEGVAAVMLGGEAQIPGLYGRIAESLKKQFGLSEEALAYWYVHDKADEDHGEAGRQVLDRFVKTDAERELVLRTAGNYMEIASLMFDDIWARARVLKYLLEQDPMPAITVALADIPDGGAKIVVAGERLKIALFRVGERVAAINNRCPHAGGALGEGSFDGTTVNCPLHGFRVDVWRGIGNAGKPVKTYPVAVEGGQVTVTAPDQ